MQATIDILTIALIASLLLAATVAAVRALSPYGRFPGLDRQATWILLVAMGLFSAGSGLILLILLGIAR